MPRREAGEPYYRVSLDEAAEMYEDENSLVIDVRRPDEYLNGHVKNATHIVVDNLYSITITITLHNITDHIFLGCYQQHSANPIPHHHRYAPSQTCSVLSS